METISMTEVNGWTIRMTAADRYNDYSVIHDFRLEVIEPGQRFGRTWDCGTDRALAAKFDPPRRAPQ